MLLDLESPHTLRCHALLFGQVFGLPFEKLVSLSGLDELGIDKFILTRKRLYVFSELGALLCLHLYDLR